MKSWTTVSKNDPVGIADNQAILAESALKKHQEPQVKVTQAFVGEHAGIPIHLASVLEDMKLGITQLCQPIAL